MTWQDVVIAVVQFGFAAALVPSIVSQHKPAVASSLFTAAGLTLLGSVFASLELWLSVAGTWAAAGGWWVLTLQVRGRTS